jgi:hypothetical protein
MSAKELKPKEPRLPSLAVPADLNPDLLPIAREIDRMHESVLWSAQGQFEQMKLWRAMNGVLGVPAAALAAISGGTSLAAERVTRTPGVLALIAAGLGAVLTTLNPSRRVSQSQAAANAYLELQTNARQLLTIDLLTLTSTDARQQLLTLTGKRDEINRTADPPSWYAHWRARRSIEGGRQSYETDEKPGGVTAISKDEAES